MLIACLKSFRLPLQPLHGPVIALEKRLRLLHNLFMVTVDPLPLLLRQQLRINKLLAIRYHGDMFEAEIRLTTELVRRRDFFRNDHVLDADAEIAILVVARLVGKHVPGRERDFGKRDAGPDADGAFVHVQVRADAVAGAVPVVEAFAPEELAREGVDLEARRAFGEDGGVERDDAFEHERVRLPLQLRRGAEVHRPGGVRGAVEVLGAGVAEVDCFRIDRRAEARFGFVVDHCCVRARGRDCVEGEADEVFAFGSY